MLYKEPFVLYLNISVCIILLFLALPFLLNRKEALKQRLAFSLIFFTVIVNCTTNVLVLLLGNHHLIAVVFLAFFIPLLFGPAVYYYVKHLLGSTVGKGIYATVIPGAVSFAYGIYLAFAGDEEKRHALRAIIAGDHQLFNATNVITLLFILIYCVKAWIFLRRLPLDESDRLYLQFRHKRAWANEFVVCIFVPVLGFSMIHVLVVSRLISVTTIDMDLIWMPVFMLIVYLLIAIRSMMMYKEFEHQFVLSRIEAAKAIQDQRLEIARDLHDSLGAQLTFIASVSDGIMRSSGTLEERLRTKAGRLSDFTESAISDLKNALWVLNTDELRLEDLKNKLLNFIRAAGEAREDMHFHFEFGIEENVRIDSRLAVHILRIVQEVVNNTAKYAMATDVWLTASQDGSSLRLEIRDNGIGFDAAAVQGKSSGLSNLMQRVQAMNGQIQMVSEAKKGTCYSIEIPLR